MPRQSLILALGFLLLSTAAAAQQTFVGFATQFHAVPESAGTHALVVTRSGDLSGTTQMPYSVNMYGTSASDFAIPAPSPLIFAPGETTKSIVIHVVDDTIAEPDEFIYLNLTGPSDMVTIVSAVVTIEDDDSDFTISRPVVQENAGAAVVTIARRGDLSAARTLRAATQPSSLYYYLEAQEYADFIPVAATLTFAPGERSKTLVIPIVDDAVPETQESFTVRVDAVSARVTIRDDEVVEVALHDATVSESDGEAVVELWLSQSFPSSVYLNLQVGGGTATAGEDYLAPYSSLYGYVQPGTRRLRLSFGVIGDLNPEGDETFVVRITSACSGSCTERNLLITKGVATVTIRDDDPAFTADDTVAGENGTSSATFTVRLTTALPAPATVDYAVTPATAGDDDFIASRGTLTFAPGETSKTVSVPVIDDALPEDEELFVLRLSNPAGAPLLRAQAIARILDDDPHFTATKNLEYAIADGIPLHLDLYVPTTGNGSYPLVIWVPGDDWMTAPRWPTPAFRQVNRGYAVAVVQYRTIESGVFPAPLHDLKAAVRWLRANAARFQLDPNRVAAWGAGAGAHLASLLGTTDGLSALDDPTLGNPAVSSRVQAVVDWAGPSDLGSLGREALPCSTVNYDAIASNVSLLLGCPAVVCTTEAVKASPAAYVTPDDAAFLIMHGEEDCLVSPRQSESFARLLKLRKVDVTLKLYPGLGHIDGSWETPESFATVDAFLDSHLKPGPRRRSTR